MAEEKFDKNKYKNQFIRETYDRINLTVTKGKKEEIKAYAATMGESVNAYINRLINEDMKNNG